MASSSYQAKRRVSLQDDDQPKNNKFRVIYATRTHSQVQEFLSEFKKTRFVKVFSAMELASRKYYCFNEKLNKFDNNHMRKEKCKEERSSKGGCLYYNYQRIFNSKFELFPFKTAQLKVDIAPLKLAPQLPSKPIVDIEDISAYYQPKKVCAYFATKENSKFADVEAADLDHLHPLRLVVGRRRPPESGPQRSVTHYRAFRRGAQHRRIDQQPEHRQSQVGGAWRRSHI